MTRSQDQTSNQIEELAQSLALVLEPLAGDELVSATTQAIVKHRKLIDQLELAYDALRDIADDDPGRDKLMKAYSDAMLNNRAQIAVVAALTDKLGYIPEVPPVSNPRP
ncbi:hypothetical protein C5748_10515 [Phyllobacterium phragmitis]|uniref:Uncharacterized protein n=1 Tax=Phyllobacterium phragmitis TaxID=2670329 RepID=A0A2S9IT14_9HYPH|nr:transcriptional repressor TraM [Phyllobacterium phragmitis]PRD43672.1 hypothetical protein C5748_10515 [Phyllobacterium phragmitis]